MNLIAGCLFGTLAGLPLTLTLTAIGSLGAYTLSTFVLRPIVEYLFSAKIERLRTIVGQQDNSKSASARRRELLLSLISLRLFPLTPHWLFNLSAPIIGIPAPLFFVSVLIGQMPYNFVCVQAGSVLKHTLSLDKVSVGDVFTPSTVALLMGLAILTALPNLAKAFAKKKTKDSS
jgi:uncharacterized membrane protein YdjX (TVP38/TMEM64 family)